MTNCGWIFEWGDPSKDCGLELHHESPHVPGEEVPLQVEPSIWAWPPRRVGG